MNLIVHNAHKDVKQISINRCPNRNFYCPKLISDKVSVYKEGARFINLNGEYDFAYFEKGQKFNESVKFNKVKVPATWQCFGYGKVAYVNDRYLIELKPPLIDDSDYGVYKKVFKLNKKENQRYYINFEGKDSCLYLYINGEFVGFDSVAHCTSEFDITDFVKDGDNEMVVFVYVYSVGTYFECQDKFRLSGLFRDVYILEREEQHIESYIVSYVKINNTDIKVSIDFVSPLIEKEIKVLDTDISLKTNENHVEFVVKNAKLWNAEEPNLYVLSILANNEQIYDYLSFRFVELIDNVMYLNGKTIKILGTNHHDSKYETGYYLTLDDYKKDLSLMKDAHMNGVRTSHYPPAPEFLFLCDEMGMYVIDEADLECHGSTWAHGSYNLADFDTITDNVIFDECIKDRIDRLYSRDVNRQCVLFWSGGNEAGYGQVIIKYLKYLKELDPTRIVHYESLYTGHPERNNYKLDIISQMYPSVEKIKDTLANDDRAFILCEYCHAMGNSCGDIHDYVEYFYEEKRVIGGFIWEFNDHLFPRDLNLNKPGYGGDFKEPLHMGNFCVDGLITYKREPSTNFLEVKAAYSRLVINKNENNYYLESRFDFVSKEDVVIKANDVEIKVKSIAPHEKLLVLTSEAPVINFKVYLNDKLYSEYSFVNELPNKVEPIVSNAEIINASDLELKNQDIKVKISKETGLINSVTFKGKEIVVGSYLDLLRAPIDNDQYEIQAWKDQGLYSYKVLLDKFEIKKNALEVSIKCSAVCKGKITYKLSRDKVGIDLSFDISEHVKYLPRFGYVLFINNEYKDYKYIGYGPYESYCDKKYLDSYGEFDDRITDSISYVKPQETLSHLANEVSLSSSDSLIKVVGMNSFSYLPYSKDTLMNTKHNYELSKDNKCNYLSLDYKMTGVGSHACGPELLEKYKLMDKQINYSLILEVK